MLLNCRIYHHFYLINILNKNNFRIFFKIKIQLNYSQLLKSGKNPFYFYIVYFFPYQYCQVKKQMTKSSDDIIILSDEEDDIKIESVIIPERIKPVNNPPPPPPPPPSSTKRRAPILVLTEPKSISYGIERGYKLKYIHGLKRLPNNNELMYLVEYNLCDDYEFVPSNILRQFCNEDLLIEYLQKLSQFTD
jgi:hypothetical protein